MVLSKFIFPNLRGYQRRWLKSDLMAAMVVTAIAIPESLGFAVIVGLPVQTGLYCALLAPIVFAAFTSSRRLVVGADSATAALVAAGGATIAAAGTTEYANAIAVLGITTALVLLGMSAARFGFMADLISRPVLIGFISGVGVQLLIGKLPEMLGQHAHGSIIDKFLFVATHLAHIEWLTAGLAAAVVAVVVFGWKYNYPGALIALVGAIVATKVFDLHHLGIEVIGAVPPGLPALMWPNITLGLMVTLLPTAFSIAVVILAQSLAVIRSSAARHDEKVNDNQDLMALGMANATSALVGGFAINGSPPRTSAGELAGGRSQLVNVIMSLLIGLVLVVATGLFAYVPQASLAAIVFTIGLHLVKISELRDIWAMRRSEFAIAMAALIAVALLGVQKGVMLAVLLSLVERLRRQYHPHDDILLRDQEYAEWAADRFSKGKNPVAAPAGVLAYRFNDAIFFENSGYFLERVSKLVASTKQPVRVFILDASAITDVDYTAAQTLIRLINQLDADDIQFCLAHAAPRLRALFKRYGLIDLIGSKNIFPNLRFAIEAQIKNIDDKAERIQSLGIKPQDYVVIGGAALELMKIRSTNDIDLVVNQSVYDKFKDKGWKEFVHDDGKRVLTRDGYHLMLQWMGLNIHDLQKTAVNITSLPIMSMPDLVECKIKLGRRKDLEDVILIKSHGVLHGQAATA